VKKARDAIEQVKKLGPLPIDNIVNDGILNQLFDAEEEKKAMDDEDDDIVGDENDDDDENQIDDDDEDDDDDENNDDDYDDKNDDVIEAKNDDDASPSPPSDSILLANMGVNMESIRKSISENNGMTGAKNDNVAPPSPPSDSNPLANMGIDIESIRESISEFIDDEDDDVVGDENDDDDEIDDDENDDDDDDENDDDDDDENDDVIEADDDDASPLSPSDSNLLANMDIDMESIRKHIGDVAVKTANHLTDNSSTNGSPVEKLIHEAEIVLEKVDRTIAKKMLSNISDSETIGKIDYAALHSGGSVVRTRTSPSITNTLPVLNRLMVYAKLRFYGHPPEAALTVTHPENALGQCWAFPSREETSEGDHDMAMGFYGSLSVQLARPIRILTVALEHPPKTITSNLGSALKEFRVFGYRDFENFSEPYYLGEFVYDIDSISPVQEFKVETLTDDNQPIPELAVVTLAVDSNWGHEHYTCLYRFRVHGG